MEFIIERSPKIVVPWLNIWKVHEENKEISKQTGHESRMREDGGTEEQVTEKLQTEGVVSAAVRLQSGSFLSEGTCPSRLLGDTEGILGVIQELHGDVCKDSEINEVYQEPKKSLKPDKEGTKKLKLRDVSVQYQKFNVKTLKCKEGKKKKRKKVKKKVIPPAPPKKIADSSDDDQ